MGTRSPLARYDSVAMLLHWLIALLIVADFALSQSFSRFNPGDTLYFTSAYALHMAVGLCILLLSVVRIGWRLTHRLAPLPDIGLPLRLLARASHLFLYVFMLAAPVSGWLVLSLRHQRTSVFGLFSWTWPLPAIATMPHSERAIWHDALLPAHVWMSYIGMILAGLHVAAALYHHFGWRDEVLERMLPARRAGARASRAARVASSWLLALALLASGGRAFAATAVYTIDPSHTHPLFEVDHFDGLSVWRGLFRSSRGTVTLDRDKGVGSVEIVIETGSIDFGHDKLNQIIAGEKVGDWNGLDAGRFPTAEYRGTLVGFVNGAPTSVTGELSLHGVTRPVTLTINTFKCIPRHPISGREVCGADASGSFNRADFGVNAGMQYGFRQEVTLRIQVEAIRQQ